MNHIEDAVELLAAHPKLATLPPDTLQKIIDALKVALPTILEIINLFHTPSPTLPSK